ncbi:hypothetical protein HYU07_02335 [Candidatus Woesearchaeota archaeon]|nr:hypothetical protein [Candidatus Woesearchaeota archaeon]
MVRMNIMSPGIFLRKGASAVLILASLILGYSASRGCVNFFRQNYSAEARQKTRYDKTIKEIQKGIINSEFEKAENLIQRLEHEDGWKQYPEAATAITDLESKIKVRKEKLQKEGLLTQKEQSQTYDEKKNLSGLSQNEIEIQLNKFKTSNDIEGWINFSKKFMDDRYGLILKTPPTDSKLEENVTALYESYKQFLMFANNEKDPTAFSITKKEGMNWLVGKLNEVFISYIRPLQGRLISTASSLYTLPNNPKSSYNEQLRLYGDLKKGGAEYATSIKAVCSAIRSYGAEFPVDIKDTDSTIHRRFSYSLEDLKNKNDALKFNVNVLKNAEETIKQVNESSDELDLTMNYILNKSTKSCFIATAVYGNINHPSVVVLREIRDDVLLKNPLGAACVHFYYSGTGEFAARVVENSPMKNNVKKVIKETLDIVVESYKSHNHKKIEAVHND